MTEQGAEQVRFRLDLEMTERRDPAEEPEEYAEQVEFLRRLGWNLKVRGRWTEPGDPGFDQSGIGFFCQYRFTSDDPEQLLQVARRYIAEDNDEAELAIVEQTSGRVLELVEVFGTVQLAAPSLAPLQNGRFNLLNFSVRVTAPVTWTDDRSREAHDAVRALLRGHLELVRDHVGHRYGGAQVEFEL